MYERSQEFVYASRTQNWSLHLDSCRKLAIDFHSTDRIKYMRMFPYISTQLSLEQNCPYTWQCMQDGQFSVVKSKLPFVGLDVDHAGEQENKLIKISGGLCGIATNTNARERYFATAPIMRALFNTSKENQKHHNLSQSKIREQENRVERLANGIALHQTLFLWMIQAHCGIYIQMLL